jgi:hypothetical protein
MGSERDGDDLVVHPLQLPILLAHGDDIATMLSEAVPVGQWSPGPAYVCLSQKRSGGYRELCFPSVIDSIVGRCAIDALEPAITADDNHRAFSGRAHANANRLAGDYERWFSMWRDYAAELASAAREAGFTYIYDTDVSDFFPSIDSNKAKEFLARRTRAHPDLLALLFRCLDVWLPCFTYSPMRGLPIENNDVSRLVAHNYLKQVDQRFNDEDECIYLRFVDDTVIFAESDRSAQELKQRHHLALRAIGLNPNAAKSEILDVRAFEEKRHKAFASEIDRVKTSRNENDFSELVQKWRRQAASLSVDSWEPVMRRLYSLGRQLSSPFLRTAVVDDIANYPTLTEHALHYLARFNVSRSESERLISVVKHASLTPDVDIHLARFFSDAIFESSVSEDIAHMAVLRITRDSFSHGVGYAKGLWLLALHKHGKHEHRQTILQWASIARLLDEAFRLHFMYVYFCVDELPDHLRLPLRHLDTSDISLTMRCCEEAKRGSLPRRTEILDRMTRHVYGRRTIAARYLPLLRVMMQRGSPYRSEDLSWIKARLNDRHKPECSIVHRFLEHLAHNLDA